MSGIQSISVSASQSYATVSTQTQPSLQPFSNLNLTEAQRTQLRSIFQAAQQNGTSQANVEQQVSSVLTPAQQQTLVADLKAGKSGQHRHHGAESGSQQAAATPATVAPAQSAQSTDTTVLDLVTNVQNQVAAAQSTLLDTLQKQVLARNGTPETT